MPSAVDGEILSVTAANGGTGDALVVDEKPVHIVTTGNVQHLERDFNKEAGIGAQRPSAEFVLARLCRISVALYKFNLAIFDRVAVVAAGETF